jgi:hypothetical protein
MRIVRRLGSLLRHALVLEAAVWVALARWIGRRPDVPGGATPLTYGRLVTPIMWLFVWGSTLEVVAVDLVVHHLGWTAVRVPLLLVGVWSVVWMVGLLAAVRTRPHVVTADRVLLRAGLTAEVVLPVSSVTGVAIREHGLSSSMRTVEVLDGRLLVGVSGRTNLVLLLDGPTALTTPRGDVTVAEVGLWVDEPQQARDVLRRREPVG